MAFIAEAASVPGDVDPNQEAHAHRKVEDVLAMREVGKADHVEARLLDQLQQLLHFLSRLQAAKRITLVFLDVGALDEDGLAEGVQSSVSTHFQTVHPQPGIAKDDRLGIRKDPPAGSAGAERTRLLGVQGFCMSFVQSGGLADIPVLRLPIVAAQHLAVFRLDRVELSQMGQSSEVVRGLVDPLGIYPGSEHASAEVLRFRLRGRTSTFLAAHIHRHLDRDLVQSRGLLQLGKPGHVNVEVDVHVHAKMISLQSAEGRMDVGNVNRSGSEKIRIALQPSADEPVDELPGQGVNVRHVLRGDEDVALLGFRWVRNGKLH
eukprot:scaffold1596_cov302-Pinguiococcus_pyrenoidosus.AAC.4